MYLTYDNGGRTADRYTVFPYRRLAGTYGQGACLGLSDDCTSPQGFSQWGEGVPGRHLGKRIPFASLPEHVRAHVLARIKED